MRSLVQFCENLQVKTKFLLILFVAIVMVSSTAVLTMHFPLRVYDEQLYESSAQKVTLFAEQIKSELENFDSLSYQILTDRVLQENLTVMKNHSPGNIAWVKAQREVANRAAYFSLWFKNTRSFQLRSVQGKTYSQFFGAPVNRERLTREYVELALENKGRAVWKAEAGESPSLFLFREIREINSLSFQPLGTILIELNFPELVEQYRYGMTRMGTPLECAIYRGEVCLYASNEDIGRLPAGQNGYVHMKLNHRDVLCVRYTASNGLRYVTAVDYQDIRRTTLTAVAVTIGSILLATLLAAVVCLLLLGSITNPLQALFVKFDEFASSGKVIKETDARYKYRRDEIGSLHRRFDLMTREWDELLQEKEEQQRLLQEKQMQQLRAQIRPHFLYNTLESIYCMAQMLEDTRIAVMTEALGKLLRASINDKRDIISVEEDLGFTQEYLRIQLLRYGERLQVEYELAPEVLACRLPAMTIQPLVENAIHHAAEKMFETCRIRISGEIEAGDVYITVENNGPSIDEDILEKLASGEIKAEGLGIGMQNIHKRVQHAFSGRYGLIVSNVNGRVQVMIHLPGEWSDKHERGQNV